MLHKNITSIKNHIYYLISVSVIISSFGNGQTASSENNTKLPLAALPPTISSLSSASVAAAAAAPAAYPLVHPLSTSSVVPQTNAAVRALFRLYEECTRAEVGFVPCLKKKAITFIDRISHFDTISVAEGVKVIRVPTLKARLQPPPVVDEIALQASVSRSLVDRDVTLSHLLLERLCQYFEEHTLQVSLPKFSTSQIGRSLGEGRAKMKKMMQMMMMGMAMKMIGMLPVAMGFLYILAGKAFIIAKIAFLLSAIMIVKKLMQSKGGGSSSSSWPSSNGGGWSSSGGGGGGGGGGWERRSLAQDLAYRGYSRELQKLQQQKQLQQKAPQQLLQIDTKKQ